MGGLQDVQEPATNQVRAPSKRGPMRRRHNSLGPCVRASRERGALLWCRQMQTSSGWVVVVRGVSEVR
jgi:hypothetical protein